MAPLKPPPARDRLGVDGVDADGPEGGCLEASARAAVCRIPSRMRLAAQSGSSSSPLLEVVLPVVGAGVSAADGTISNRSFCKPVRSLPVLSKSDSDAAAANLSPPGRLAPPWVRSVVGAYTRNWIEASRLRSRYRRGKVSVSPWLETSVLPALLVLMLPILGSNLATWVDMQVGGGSEDDRARATASNPGSNPGSREMGTRGA